jgi:hypothetical protein
MTGRVEISEFDTIKKDAFTSEGKSAEERTAMFLGLMDAVEAMRAHLTADERERRRVIADQIDPRPDPWWRNIRPEALAEYQCKTSSI